MKKLNTKNEFQDQQQEKHDTYLNKGFKLVSTRTDKEGNVVRRYIK